jgi:uroporphyrinogen-III synthase
MFFSLAGDLFAVRTLTLACIGSATLSAFRQFMLFKELICNYNSGAIQKLAITIYPEVIQAWNAARGQARIPDFVYGLFS